ncbi:MAG: GNAT family N-acyltransferase [Pseudomonadota bacterium]
MTGRTGQFVLRLARSDEDIVAAQRLRYRVFVEELQGDGPMVDHDARLERDRFDPFFDHLVLFDEAWEGDHIDSAVGVYRLMRDDQAQRAGGFYSADEYDLSALKATGRRLVELGRSCVDSRVRGGTAMFHLWNGLADYVLSHGIDVLFGVASFHGTDIDRLRQPLAYLHHHYLAPPEIRVRVQPGHFQTMDLMAKNAVDKTRAMVSMPALIKAYLRLGGFVGEGAFIDHDFNTVDVCLLMDTAQMSAKHRAYYTKGRVA